MHIEKRDHLRKRTIIVGAGMAGLSAAITLAAKGENVVLIETREAGGGKMRALTTKIGPVDSGPTVFTMKYVFDHLFSLANTNLSSHLTLQKSTILARHAWDESGVFDLYADRVRAADEIGRFFGQADAKGYTQFCADAGKIFETLKETFIGAQRPGPLELGRRVGLLKPAKLWGLRPMQTLWSALGKYFSDYRLRQLFGRYATYVGSSPFEAPATLMLIAHVEQEGVWLVEGGMIRLAEAMTKLAKDQGADIRTGTAVNRIILENGRASGVELTNGELLAADTILFCGDVSDLSRKLLTGAKGAPTAVPPEKRSLSAITWSMEAEATGLSLLRHNVFFGPDYLEEFEAIFSRGYAPLRPTVYVCAQDRETNEPQDLLASERLFCLVNSPANGDQQRLSEKELEQCQKNMTATLNRCGLHIKALHQHITQPADFNQMFPGSGGALYGRASHGWTASFARPGATTKIPGLYLAGGSVHPGAGVPMATLSGMLAAERIMMDHVLI